MAVFLKVSISINGTEVVAEKMSSLRDIWEATSVQLEQRQANPACVLQEADGLKHRVAPPYKLTFDPSALLAQGAQLEKGSSKFHYTSFIGRPHEAK